MRYKIQDFEQSCIFLTFTFGSWFDYLKDFQFDPYTSGLRGLYSPQFVHVTENL